MHFFLALEGLNTLYVGYFLSATVFFFKQSLGNILSVLHFNSVCSVISRPFKISSSNFMQILTIIRRSTKYKNQNSGLPINELN